MRRTTPLDFRDGKSGLDACGPQVPQVGVVGTDALPVRMRDAHGQVWVVGAHGGAGESTIAAADPLLRCADRAWPGPDQVCVLVARTSASALMAAQAALAQWASGGAGTTLLGLVLIADAPGRLPTPLKDLAGVVAGGAPRVWRIGWSQHIRLGEADPALYRTLIRDLHELTRPAANPHAHTQLEDGGTQLEFADIPECWPAENPPPATGTVVGADEPLSAGNVSALGTSPAGELPACDPAPEETTAARDSIWVPAPDLWAAPATTDLSIEDLSALVDHSAREGAALGLVASADDVRVTSSQHPRGRWVTVAAAAGAVVLVGGMAIAAAPASGTPDAVTPATTAAHTPAAGPNPAGDDAVTPRMLQGGVLPVSHSAGPNALTAGTAAGFTQTPLGAAIAAAQLSARLSPTVGPEVFQAVIDNQMVGAPASISAYRAAIVAAYRAAARRGEITDGGPILAPRTSITAWRVPEQLTGDVPVQLATSSPDGAAAIWTILLRWQQGDWRIVVPTGTTAWTKSESSTTTGFTPFYPTMEAASR